MYNKQREKVTCKASTNHGDNGRLRSSYRSLGLMVSVMLLLTIILAGCGSSSNNSNTSAKSSMSMAQSDSAMANESLEYEVADQYGSSANVAVATTASSSGSSSAETPMKSEQDTAAPSSVAGQGTAPSVIGAIDRKLIYNANVSMEVEKYGDAQTELFNIISLSGGYLLNFSDNQTSYELGGVFVVKVPSNGFQPFLSRLEELKKGDKFQRNVRAQDVTEEYVDLESRLKAKQVVEARLLSFMDKATDTKDLLSYSNELANVQEQIEQMKGRMRYIDQNVAYSTVEVRMYEKLEGSKSMDDTEERNAFERAAAAMKGSSKAILAFIEGLVIVLAGAIPILLLLAVVVVPIIILYRKSGYRRDRSARPTIERNSGYGMKVEPEKDEQGDDHKQR